MTLPILVFHHWRKYYSVMITQKQIIDLAREALGNAFKSWLNENRDELLRLMSVSTQNARAKIPEQQTTAKEEKVAVKLSRHPVVDDKRPVYLTPRQLAARWGWHHESIRRMLRERRLQATRIGRRMLVELRAVEKLEQECTLPSATGVGEK
jgi:excisionase family DNA binding protein